MKKYTLAEMKKACPHWFEKGAMAFFDSRIESKPDAWNMFLTSEQFEHHMERRYTIRMFVPLANGGSKIATVGPFHEYTLEEAKALQEELRRIFKEVCGNREREILENLSYVNIWPDDPSCREFHAGDKSFVVSPFNLGGRYIVN